MIQGSHGHQVETAAGHGTLEFILNKLCGDYYTSMFL